MCLQRRGAHLGHIFDFKFTAEIAVLR